MSILTQSVHAGGLPGAVFNLNGVGRYVHLGSIEISVANLVVFGLMVLVFALAVAVPFAHGRERR